MTFQSRFHAALTKTLFILLFGVVSACGKSSSPFSGGQGNNNPPVDTAHPILPHKTMCVDGARLRDSSGSTFVMRGSNFPVFWFPNDYKNAIISAAGLHCNAARLVWQVQQQSYTPTLAVLDEALSTCRNNKMIPIVELHDYTGGTDANDLISAANYFSKQEVKAILDKYSDILIINIANEWGGSSVTDNLWRNAYIPAIAVLRKAGYKVPLMIDAPGYGQQESAITQFGKDVLQSDSLRNIIFSAHAYSNWNVSSTYGARITNITAQNLCLVFGEFGWNVPDNQQPSSFTCKVDAPLLMQICQQNNVGYLGWSWSGNDANNACFDLSKSWSDTTQLTTWGRQWAYDANGVKITAISASVFK